MIKFLCSFLFFLSLMILSFLPLCYAKETLCQKWEVFLKESPHCSDPESKKCYEAFVTEEKQTSKVPSKEIKKNLEKECDVKIKESNLNTALGSGGAIAMLGGIGTAIGIAKNIHDIRHPPKSQTITKTEIMTRKVHVTDSSTQTEIGDERKILVPRRRIQTATLTPPSHSSLSPSKKRKLEE